MSHNHQRTSIRSVQLSLMAVMMLLQLGATRCTRGDATKTTTTGTPTRADSAEQVLFGARHELTNQGRTRGLLVADTAYKYEDGTLFELRHVSVTIVDTSRVKKAEITATRGTLDIAKARLNLSGSVLYTGVDGRTLQTTQLAFDLEHNMLSGDSAYTTGGGRQSSGAGFEADPLLTRVTPRKAASK